MHFRVYSPAQNRAQNYPKKKRFRQVKTHVDQYQYVFKSGT